MRIPKISSIETAIEIYYTNIELSNKELRRLFTPSHGKEISVTTMARLKKAVMETQLERGVPIWNATCVNTKVAYEVWGLEISDLEKRLKMLNRLKTGA